MYMYTYMYRLSQAGFESGGWRQGKRVVWAEQGGSRGGGRLGG